MIDTNVITTPDMTAKEREAAVRAHVRSQLLLIMEHPSWQIFVDGLEQRTRALTNDLLRGQKDQRAEDRLRGEIEALQWMGKAKGRTQENQRRYEAMKQNAAQAAAQERQHGQEHQG